MTQSHNGEATHNRDAEKYRKHHDEAFTKELHKDTTANTATKRQVSDADRPAGVKSRTIYRAKA
jgi:hypothetical protein